MDRSVEHFGTAAADRYEALIGQARRVDQCPLVKRRPKG